MPFFRKLRKIFGPGVVTGAADDDPSGIATYSQTGAQFGYSLLWTAAFMLPLQTAIQEACARIGAVTGKGIAAVVKEHYSQRLLYVVVFLVLVANIINIGADIGAMAAATHLIIPVNTVVLTFIFTVVTLFLEIFVTYQRYSQYLKWLCLSLIAYPLTVMIADVPWLTVLKATFLPHLEFNFQFLFILTGVLGTTISPYLFFWQASQEVEEEHLHHQLKKNGRVMLRPGFMRDLRIDNFIGMLFSEIATWSIIVVTATVLNAHGVTNIETAADAAKALEPLVDSFPHAGTLAKLIFAVGIVGLGMLSIPVLAGSAAYALSEALSWREGLNLKFKSAHGFYGVITIATMIGLGINFIGVDPVKILVYAAVINGVVAVPLIFVIARIASNKKIMGDYQSGRLSQILVWLTFLAMGLAGLGMVMTYV